MERGRVGMRHARSTQLVMNLLITYIGLPHTAGRTSQKDGRNVIPGHKDYITHYIFQRAVARSIQIRRRGKLMGA